MLRKLLRVFFMFTIIIKYCCPIPQSFGFDNINTHPEVTEIAIESASQLNRALSEIGLDRSYIIDYNQNDDHVNKTIKNWLKYGSKKEDEPVCRASNHFHNPLKHTPWSDAGVSDMDTSFLGVLSDGYCVSYNDVTGTDQKRYSNLVWVTSSSSNDMGWNAARNFYGQALTSTPKNDREKYLAKTFQALGQVMHLIQDMAVPAHVRNDYKDHTEYQAVNGINPINWFSDGFEWYVKHNTVSATPTAIDSPNNLLTGFWDTDQYNGENPSSSQSQGLAEYTNANFFSGSTVFTENNDTSDLHRFPYPSKIETDAKAVEVLAEDGATDKRSYVYKSDKKLAAYSFYNQWIENTESGSDGSQIPQPYVIQEGWKYILDEEVFKDYETQLLPRAVGYSAGLLNYFFRGEMDIKVDPSSQDSYIIENKSEETMSGTFALYYDKKSNDPNNIQRFPVKDGFGNYVVWRFTGEDAILAGQTRSVTFTEPLDMQQRGKYILVFNGRLGNEEGAVVGKSVTALCSDAEWKFLNVESFRWDSDGDGETYINDYIGNAFTVCEEEQGDESFRHTLFYKCVYRSGGVDGGDCPLITQEITHPACAPKNIDACNFVPYSWKTCGTILYSATNYVKGCPQK